MLQRMLVQIPKKAKTNFDIIQKTINRYEVQTKYTKYETVKKEKFIEEPTHNIH